MRVVYFVHPIYDRPLERRYGGVSIIVMVTKSILRATSLCHIVARLLTFGLEVTILYDKYYENEYKCKIAEYQFWDRRGVRLPEGLYRQHVNILFV